MASEKLPEAIDLSHHLSRLSRARPLSPLKSLQKYFQRPGMITLAGGLPPPILFPFASTSAEGLVPDSFPLTRAEGTSTLSWLWRLFGASGNKERTSTLTVNKYPAHPDDVNLAAALQYGPATGLPQLQKIMNEFTEKVYQPGYINFTTLVHAGNTDGWGKAALTLLNPGEGFLTSEWTYPSALASTKPYNINPVPVAMDGQGMRSDALRTLLAEWNEEARGMPRPHVMYTIPVGQNPTGACMQEQRKKEIYAICVEFDVIIVEDDPYYFLQFNAYSPKERRSHEAPPSDDDNKFIASLAPSYLRLDYQGRVIRLDTFSKTIAPGSRLGWFTCNPVFAERLERQGETSTQNPCGFGQVMVTSLLLNWRYEGYLRWLKALRIQYQQRRDFFLDTLKDEFHVQLVPATSGPRSGCEVFTAFAKSQEKFSGSKPLFSFVPPVAGMFVWLRIHFEHHASFQKEGYKPLEEKLFIELAEAGVLFGPGYMFSAIPVTDEEEGDGHFRISFSSTEPDDVKKALKIFGKVLRKFMAQL